MCASSASSQLQEVVPPRVAQQEVGGTDKGLAGLFISGIDAHEQLCERCARTAGDGLYH
jgi:hypothetical protein